MSISFETMAAIRFGYGFKPGETTPKSVDALLKSVEEGMRETCLFPDRGIAQRITDAREIQALGIRLRREYRQMKKDGVDMTKRRKGPNPFQLATAQLLQADSHQKIQQMVASPHGFFERLVSFWVDHFSVSAGKNAVVRMLVAHYETAAIRPHVGARFETLLTAAILHPAMLEYLDQGRSLGPNSVLGKRRGRGLNENLGRELIELHTMGAGSGYTQDDVRNAALVLTGLFVDQRELTVDFGVNRAEPGAHTVLGKSYGGERRTIRDAEALIRDLAAHEATRKHICRKLVVHFLADEPPADIVAAMEERWIATDGDLMAVYRAMLEHPASFAGEGQKARQALDFVVAALRALDVPLEAIDPLERRANRREMAEMDGAKRPAQGAPMMDGEAGADMMAMDDGDMDAEGMDAGNMEAGMTPQRRMRPNPLTVVTLRQLGQPIWSPPSPAGWEEGFSAWVTPSQLTERIEWARRLTARFGKETDPRGFLEATLKDAARDDTILVVERASSKQSGLTLVLASPEFNRR